MWKAKLQSGVKNLRAWSRAVRAWSRAAPSKWWFSALTAVLGAFAGLLGSIYAEDIKSAVPFILLTEQRLWVSGPVHLWAVFFWISLFIFGLFFGLGFNAQNEATNKLEQVIRTLPPKGFLVAFEEYFRSSFGIDWIAHQAGKGAKELSGSILVALNGVALLAKTFDARHDHPTYAINIMLFRPIADVSPEELKKQIRFAEPGYNTASWDGVLQLQSEFAYTLSEKGAIQPDEAVPAIMLPIPKSEFRADNGRPTVLPGAPKVYCEPSVSFAGFEDTRELSAWCRNHSGLRASIADDIEAYFLRGPGKLIRSFISIPITLPSDEGVQSTVLGVLNIHCDRERMLPRDKSELFVPLSSPFVLLIARALEKYVSLSKQPQRA